MLWYKSLPRDPEPNPDGCRRALYCMCTDRFQPTCHARTCRCADDLCHVHLEVGLQQYRPRHILDSFCHSRLREPVTGARSATSGFTLALPVSRRRIVYTRAVIGYLGVLILAAVPIVAVPIASRYVGEQYPVAQNVGFFFLWAACGAVFYGITFLLAHRLEGDYISVLLAIPLLMLYKRGTCESALALRVAYAEHLRNPQR